MRMSLEGKLAALLLGALSLGAILTAAMSALTGWPVMAALAAVLLGLLPVIWLTRSAVAPVRRLLVIFYRLLILTLRQPKPSLALSLEQTLLTPQMVIFKPMQPRFITILITD